MSDRTYKILVLVLATLLYAVLSVAIWRVDVYAARVAVVATWVLFVTCLGVGWVLYLDEHDR